MCGEVMDDLLNDIGEIMKCWKNKVEHLPIPKVSEWTIPGSTVDVIFHVTLIGTAWSCDMGQLWMYHAYVLKAKCKSLTIFLSCNIQKEHTEILNQSHILAGTNICSKEKCRQHHREEAL